MVPEAETIYDDMAIKLAKQLNETVEELNIASSKNYDKFKIQISSIPWNSSPRTIVRSLEYKSKLSGLINRVQLEFFTEDQPSATGPSTIINANQTQSQTQSINTILEIQEKLLSEIPKHKEGSKERTFLEKVKSALPNMKTGTEIISNILKIGAEIGLHASEIATLLHF